MDDSRHDFSARILAVDDDPGVTRIIRAMLEVAGHRVEEARGAVGLAARVGDSAPDLILLDKHMPELGGLEALAELRRAGSTIPVILLTGDEESGDSARDAIAFGADDCLLKPVSMERLHAAVRSALRVAHLERQLREARTEVAQLRADLAGRSGRGTGRS